MNHKTELGKSGENIVAQKLKKDGFAILNQNYRRRFGEIDIIATKDDLLIFVEVKMRKNPLFDLAYLIGPSKQKKIISVAKEYLARYDHYGKVCRFDVALIEGTPDNYNLRYYENAFC